MGVVLVQINVVAGFIPALGDDVGGYKTRPYRLRNPRSDKKESRARNDNSLRVFARHDSAEAISVGDSPLTLWNRLCNHGDCRASLAMTGEWRKNGVTPFLV